MKTSALKTSRITAFVLCALLFSIAAFPQSTDQNFPSPVTTNEINGTIKARDIGDSRLTSYFYVFEGDQGDIFINVVTKNFTGDIDIFTADALRPLTKMVIYADAGVNETGRLIYLRKGERLILRVEGRSPNDDPAVFRVKFGGSFIALAPQKTEEAPAVTRSDEETGVRVNSVGTIIPSPPKPPPTVKPKETVVKEAVSAKAEEETKKVEPIVEPTPIKSDEEESKTETVFENKSAKVTVEEGAKPATKRPPRTPAKAAKPAGKTSNPPVKTEEKKADPLASINLVIQLKDGNVIQRPMSEVVKFSVDKGVLVVIARNGKIVRYSILDVAKVTIE